MDSAAENPSSLLSQPGLDDSHASEHVVPDLDLSFLDQVDVATVQGFQDFTLGNNGFDAPFDMSGAVDSHTVFETMFNGADAEGYSAMQGHVSDENHALTLDGPIEAPEKILEADTHGVSTPLPINGFTQSPSDHQSTQADDPYVHAPQSSRPGFSETQATERNGQSVVTQNIFESGVPNINNDSSESSLPMEMAASSSNVDPVSTYVSCDQTCQSQITDPAVKEHQNDCEGRVDTSNANNIDKTAGVGKTSTANSIEDAMETETLVESADQGEHRGSENSDGDESPKEEPPRDESMSERSEDSDAEAHPLSSGSAGAAHSGSGKRTTSDEDRRWSLRAGARTKQQSNVATWIDKDETGDYDPNAKECARPFKRPRLSDHPRKESRGTQRHRPTRSALLLRLTGDRYCVTLKMESPAAMDLLRKGKDNWPDDTYTNTLDDAAYAAEASSDEMETNGSYNLRRRGLLAASSDSECWVGKPEGRGCHYCRAIGEPCSMLDDDGAYPCENCIQEDECCEPLVPPIRKQPCEICRKAGHACSYSYDGSDHKLPCTYCTNSGFKCIAGPEIDPTRARMDSEGNPVTLKDRANRWRVGRFKSCTDCRKANRVCPLLKSRLEPPCTHCKNADIPCTFEVVKRTPKAVEKVSAPKLPTIPTSGPFKKPSAPITVQSSPGDTPASSSSSSTILPRTVQPLQGVITQIETCLSHPITFNSIPTKTCNWCSGITPFLPLFGHMDPSTSRPGGLRKVKVLLWADKQGCKELEGGYTKMGHEPCRMCPYCTLERVRQIFCTEHMFRLIPYIKSPNTPQEMQLAQEARDRKEAGRPHGALKVLGSMAYQARQHAASTSELKTSKSLRHELHKWCAVCPSVAAYECCRGDNMDCNLRLCTVCYKLVASSKSNGGNFRTFLHDIRKQSFRRPGLNEKYPNGLRADLECFDRSGFLVTQVKVCDEERRRRQEREDRVGKKEKRQAKGDKTEVEKGGSGHLKRKRADADTAEGDA